MKNRKSTKHSQAASPLKAKQSAPAGMGFLKPRKPPSGPLSMPHHAAERDEPEWGGLEEAHIDDAQERVKMKEAAMKATWAKILAEEEAERDKKQEEDAYEDDYEDDDDDDEDEDGDEDDQDAEDEDEVGTPKEAEAEQVTPAGSQMVTSADRFVDYIVRLNERRVAAMSRGLMGVSTGLPRLDQATGGLEQITLIAGQTETGKTSLATQVCLAGLRSDPKLAVVYYLMDAMTEEELFDQMVCREAGIDHEKYVGEELSEEEKNKCNSARDRLQQDVLPRMNIVDSFPNERGYGVTGGQIFDFCHRFMRRVGAARTLVVLDMFNDLPHPKNRGQWQEDHLPSIRRIENDPDGWRLEQLMELRERSHTVCNGGWPIVALCRLRKLQSQREEPGIEDLLGGVDLGYKAKRIFFLVPDAKADASKSVVPVTLVAKKGRHARKERLPLLFHHTQFRFEEGKNSTPPAGKAGGKKPPPASGQPSKSSSVDPLAGMDS